MLFNSQPFVLVFLPCVLALFHAVGDRPALRQWVLIGASLGFYGYWDWRFVPALAGLTLVNWLIVRWFGAVRRPAVLAAGVVLNLVVLGVFKYANFAADSLAGLAGGTHSRWAIILPLGISFFTFQKISYLVDLRRGGRPIYGLREFFAFVTFFPQLIAGPLVRHDEMVPQLRRSGGATAELLARGLVLFTIGIVKKVVVADTVALVCDPWFARAAAGPVSLAEAWAAAGGYTLQIYYDFSGYSDMAIGLALMFGLRLPFNFDAPYRATSIRDFWRRWHITLSRFLRDYVYVPLGGNRVGGARQAANVVATMLLGGLWHGAAWTFVAWGGAHGAALALNAAWRRAGWRMPARLGWAATLLFVVCGWVVFRSPDFATAWRVFSGMACASGVGRVHVDNAPLVGLAALAAVAGPTSQAVALDRVRPARWVAVTAGAALAFSLLVAGGRLPNEFIYFQF